MKRSLALTALLERSATEIAGIRPVGWLGGYFDRWNPTFSPVRPTFLGYTHRGFGQGAGDLLDLGESLDWEIVERSAYNHVHYDEPAGHCPVLLRCKIDGVDGLTAWAPLNVGCSRVWALREAQLVDVPDRYIIRGNELISDVDELGMILTCRGYSRGMTRDEFVDLYGIEPESWPRYFIVDRLSRVVWVKPDGAAIFEASRRPYLAPGLAALDVVGVCA